MENNHYQKNLCDKEQFTKELNSSCCIWGNFDFNKGEPILQNFFWIFRSKCRPWNAKNLAKKKLIPRVSPFIQTGKRLNNILCGHSTHQ